LDEDEDRAAELRRCGRLGRSRIWSRGRHDSSPNWMLRRMLCCYCFFGRL
jgi:hypothetical protein